MCVMTGSIVVFNRPVDNKPNIGEWVFLIGSCVLLLEGIGSALFIMPFSRESDLDVPLYSRYNVV